MARKKTNYCAICQQAFRGRADKKTCSERCRKRLQRAKSVIEQDVKEAKQAVEKSLHKIETKIVPVNAGEQGYIAGTAPTSNPIVAPDITPPPKPVDSIEPAPVNLLVKPIPMQAPPVPKTVPASFTAPSTPRPTPPPVASQPSVAPAVNDLFAPISTKEGLQPGIALETLDKRTYSEARPTFINQDTKRKLWNLRRDGVLVTATIAVVILVASLFATFQHHHQQAQDLASKIQAQNVAVEGNNPIAPSTELPLQSGADTLVLNGNLLTKGSISLYDGQNYARFQANNISGSRTFSLPDA